MKKKLIFVVIIGILVIASQWFFNHGYIEVVIDNPNNSEVTYKLLEQNTNKASEIKATQPRIKKIVRKGRHEVLVQQGETSYFSVVKASGFLSSTTVHAEVVPQKHRQFVGNNPSPCMHFIGQTLISFGCKDLFKNTQIHVPATQDRPTYTQNNPNPLEGMLEGIVATSEGTVAVIKTPAGGEDQGPPHTAYSVSEGLRLNTGTPLPDLDKNKLYSSHSYKEGFLVYDTSYEQIFYYSSVKAKPEKVTLTKPADNKFKLYKLSIQNDSIIAAYTTGVEGDAADIHDTKSDKKIKTELIIHQNNTTKSYTFNTQHGSVTLCGSSKLCLLSDKQLGIYDISGKKQKLLFTVSGVETVENLKSGLVVVREQEILELNVDAQRGSIQYRLGDYDSCGLQNTGNGYTLCLINSKKKKVALLVNPNQINTDSIDKKISELIKLPEITNVSIYDKFIYISPNLGPLVYDKPEKRYRYDPTTQKTVNEKINQEINKLVIDRNTYKIINPFE